MPDSLRDEPKFTQRMTLHLNGGKKFSRLVFDIFADDKPTGIVRLKETSGSPKYLITADEFHCGAETFDVVATRGIGMTDWLKAHTPKTDADASQASAGSNQSEEL